MKKIWVHIADSPKEARDFDIRYHLSMSPAERLETMQYLRDLHLKMNKGRKYAERRKGLRRVIKIVQ